MAHSPLRVASCQSTGKERAHNEDTLFTLQTFLGGLEAPVAFGVFLVADGMGGHQSGELASNLAAKGISQYLMRHVYQDILFERKSFSSADLEQHLKKAVEEAQALVLRRVPGGGTTLTLALVVGDEVFSAHVGDSRLYLIGPEGTLNLKTRDHSLVKRLVDLGEISESEAGHHPHRNVLYRALGQSDPFEPDIDAFALGPGDRLLICSDGLWGTVEQQTILDNLNKDGEDLEAKASALVQAANEAGGPDNISVILVERLAY
ncbi:MAG: protein phosphatase 2C domain-containing protein [Brevefilum sp.]|nr:protein phosphatase 2C domain-containing protein [Brevefilum sp.]